MTLTSTTNHVPFYFLPSFSFSSLFLCIGCVLNKVNIHKFLKTEVIYYDFWFLDGKGKRERENNMINLVPRTLSDGARLLDSQPLTFASGPALAAQTIFSPTPELEIASLPLIML